MSHIKIIAESMKQLTYLELRDFVDFVMEISSDDNGDQNSNEFMAAELLQWCNDNGDQ